jgi:hypothetical protein
MTHTDLLTDVEVEEYTRFLVRFAPGAEAGVLISMVLLGENIAEAMARTGLSERAVRVTLCRGLWRTNEGYLRLPGRAGERAEREAWLNGLYRRVVGSDRQDRLERAESLLREAGYVEEPSHPGVWHRPPGWAPRRPGQFRSGVVPPGVAFEAFKRLVKDLLGPLRLDKTCLRNTDEQVAECSGIQHTGVVNDDEAQRCALLPFRSGPSLG